MAFKDNSEHFKRKMEIAGRKWVKGSALLVEGTATLLSPVDTGDLRSGNTHRMTGTLEATVGNTAEHALYVHEGTGIYAKKGRRRTGYWVYVKGEPSGPGGKVHTLASAKRAVAILRKEGKDAYYTQGQRPQEFLKDAFEAEKTNIEKLAKQYYVEVSS